ncbi:MAG: YnfA family protein, partial [Moraxellaceae bacterium]|nr:YnfA family protein [Moraxellaceae bacterium]
MCLKQRNNAVVWWYLDPERLYQMVQPHTPCQWVGRWQAKRGDNLSFAIELTAYGGVYIFVAILWLWLVDGVRPTTWDIVGATVAVAGMAIIMFAPK